MIKFYCFNCHQKLGTRDENVGGEMQCPRCDTINKVPDPRTRSAASRSGDMEILDERLHKEPSQPNIHGLSEAPAPDELPYTVKTTLFGHHKIQYQCPSCTNELESGLNDGGQEDHCPNCGTRYTVPGVKEKVAEDARRQDNLDRLASAVAETSHAETQDDASPRLKHVAETLVTPDDKSTIGFEGRFTPQIKLLPNERILCTAEAGFLDLGIIGWLFRYKLRLIVTSHRIFRFDKKIIDNKLTILWLATITSVVVGQVIHARKFAAGIIFLILSVIIGGQLYRDVGTNLGITTFIILGLGGLLLILIARQKVLIANAGYDKTGVHLVRLATLETQKFADSVFQALNTHNHET